MKKIVVSDDVLDIFDGKMDFFGRKDIRLFTASTSAEALALHRAETANLIIIRTDLPGPRCEELGALIRKDPKLRAVSLILLCPDDPAALARAEQCGANAVLKQPVNAAQLLERARQLLEVSWRGSYRVLVSVSVEGTGKDKTFFGRSGNISTTGMLIETERVLAKGDKVKCSFFLPGAMRLTTSGEIVRDIEQAAGSKNRHYGIKFFPLSSEAAAAIEDFIDKKSQVSAFRK